MIIGTYAKKKIKLQIYKKVLKRANCTKKAGQLIGCPAFIRVTWQEFSLLPRLAD